MIKNIQTTQDTTFTVEPNIDSCQSSTENRILEILRDDDRLTVKNIAINLNLPERQIERSMAKLKQDGRLRRIGSSKSGHWEIIN